MSRLRLVAFRTPLSAWLGSVLLGSMLLGCSSRAPLRRALPAPDAATVVAAEVAARESSTALSASAWTDAALIHVLRTRHPSVRRLRAEQRAAKSLARVRTPHTNPTISLGPLAFQGDVLEWGLELALGWVLPLAPTRQMSHTVRVFESREVFAAAAAGERAAFLAARREVALWSQAHLASTAIYPLLDSANQARELSSRLIDAGEGSRMDVLLLDADVGRLESRSMRARHDADRGLDAVAESLGVAGRVVGSLPPPTVVLPMSVPPLSQLQESIARNLPELCVLRARYLTAAKRVSLEVLRGKPGLSIDPSLESEPDTDRFGLPFGFEIPIFDRNQVGVAQAVAARRGIRAAFDERVALALAALERAHADVVRRAQALDHIRAGVLPASQRIAEEARKRATQGVATGLELVQASRTAGEAALDEQEAQGDLLRAWLALEAAFGAPLVRLEPVMPSVVPIAPENN